MQGEKNGTSIYMLSLNWVGAAAGRVQHVNFATRCSPAIGKSYEEARTGRKSRLFVIQGIEKTLVRSIRFEHASQASVGRRQARPPWGTCDQ